MPSCQCINPCAAFQNTLVALREKLWNKPDKYASVAAARLQDAVRSARDDKSQTALLELLPVLRRLDLITAAQAEKTAELLGAALLRGAMPGVGRKADSRFSDNDVLDSELCAAVAARDFAAAEAKLGAGASANAKGPDGVPVLLSAIATGEPRPVRALLAAGADADARNAAGDTALTAAAAMGVAPIVADLLRAGARGKTSPCLMARADY